MKLQGHTRTLVICVISILIGAVVSALIKHGALKKVDNIHVIAGTTTPTQLAVYFVTIDRWTRQRHLHGSQRTLLFPDQFGRKFLPNPNVLGNRLQLEIERPTTLTLEELALYNVRRKEPQTFRGKALFDLLSTTNPNVDLSLENDVVAIRTSGYKSILDVELNLRQQNDRLRYGYGILFASIALLALMYGRKLQIPAIKDIKPLPGTRQVIELDGLRGVAALLVLLEHSWAPFRGAGATGVWLFFILSGYLLAQPFVSQPERAISSSYVGPYLVRRIGRIVPMYFFTVILVFGITNESGLMVEHLLFLSANSHFWTIPQELSFYLMLPFIMIVGWILHRTSTALFFPGMLMMCAIFLIFPGIIPIELPGSGRQPMVGWFLMGIVIASTKPAINHFKATYGAYEKALGFVGLLLFVLLLIASCYGITEQLVMKNVTLPSHFPRSYGIVCALVLLLTLLAPNSPLGWLLRLWPFRAIGIVGYSFYLIHPFIIALVLDLSQKFIGGSILGPGLFLLSLVLTWIACLFTYSHVERPFLSRAKINTLSQDIS